MTFLEGSYFFMPKNIVSITHWLHAGIIWSKYEKQHLPEVCLHIQVRYPDEYNKVLYIGTHCLSIWYNKLLSVHLL